jgi:hypothetical protein
MASNPLIGTWRLLSWENRSVEDGQLSYPLGEDATGYIIYNEDGYMFVAIMAPHRLRFAHDDLLSATKEEEALVHLQDRFWAMSCSAAYESAERTTRSLVNAHKASLSITQKVS